MCKFNNKIKIFSRALFSKSPGSVSETSYATGDTPRLRHTNNLCIYRLIEIGHRRYDGLTDALGGIESSIVETMDFKK